MADNNVLHTEFLNDIDTYYTNEKLAELCSEYHEDFRECEMLLMNYMDRYTALALAVGATPDAYFGDPIESHKEILEMADDIKSKAENWDWLDKSRDS